MRPVVAGFLLFLCAQAASADDVDLAVLKSTQHAGNCSCLVHVGTDRKKAILLTEYQGPGAWVNLTGDDAKLTLTRDETPAKLETGSRITRTYEGAGSTITARYRVSAVCKANTECEGYRIGGTVTAARGDQKSREYKVSGVCGCQ